MTSLQGWSLVIPNVAYHVVAQEICGQMVKNIKFFMYVINGRSLKSKSLLLTSNSTLHFDTFFFHFSFCLMDKIDANFFVNSKNLIEIRIYYYRFSVDPLHEKIYKCFNNLIYSSRHEITTLSCNEHTIEVVFG